MDHILNSTFNRYPILSIGFPQYQDIIRKYLRLPCAKGLDSV